MHTADEQPIASHLAPHRRRHRWYKQIWRYIFPPAMVFRIRVALLMIALALVLGILIANAGGGILR